MTLSLSGRVGIWLRTPRSSTNKKRAVIALSLSGRGDSNARPPRP